MIKPLLNLINNICTNHRISQQNMRVIKYFFGRKMSPQNTKFLNKLQQSNTKSLEVKQFLVQNINHNNWFVCTQVAKATNVFHIYKEVWKQVVAMLSLQINSQKQYSFKQIYYLTIFLNQINYEPVKQKDGKFVSKVLKYYKDPRFILLLPNLTLSADLFPQSITKFQDPIISMLQTKQSQFLHKILMRGVFMEYFSPSFFETLSTSKKVKLSRRIRNFLNIQINKLQKRQNQKSKQIVHRSKLQIVFEEYLNQFGFVFQRNVFIGSYEIDFLIGNKVIVQLNGNHHYCSNNTQKLNQKQMFKNRILQKNGYFIVNISINDWVTLMKSSTRTLLEQRLNYTCHLIENKYIEYLTQQETNSKI